MCGICGVYSFDHATPPLGLLRTMSATIAHRGPDDEGYHTDGPAGLAMRRLSIIDLTTGHQPISNEDGTIWIVYNGEIYNYPELRKELEHRSHRFATRSDTETVIHAYEEWGIDCLPRFNGMFAFALWDSKRSRLLIARDPTGIKPLYYYSDGRRLLFGSEIKTLLAAGAPRTLDTEALDYFLTFEYVPAPLTLFRGIQKLLPGHALTVEGGQVTIRKYWDVRARPLKGTEEEIADQLYQVLRESVKMRLLSDVPLGAFLSGGIDSSSVVALMSEIMDQPVKTFSIGFDDKTYSELKYAREVAAHFGTEHREFILKPDGCEIEHLIRFMDDPIADFSIFPTYLVSRVAREHVKVILSGDGGDELFAGYDTYIANKVAGYYRRLPGVLRENVTAMLSRVPPSAKKKGIVNRAKRFVEGASLPQRMNHVRWMMFLGEVEKELLYNGSMTSHRRSDHLLVTQYFDSQEWADSLNRQLYVDLKTYLVDDILVKVDRMSMAVSLEARVPFLDHDLIDFVAGIPGELKLKGMTTKYILKKSMERVLPASILYRKKEGFSIPMKQWLTGSLRPLMQDMLSEDRLRRQGLFSPQYVGSIMSEHLKGRANHSHRLWALVLFQLWHDTFLTGPVARDEAVVA